MADDHPEGVAVDVPDNGGRLNDAAGNKTDPPSDQLGGTERVGEDGVVQAGDTTEDIQRNRADSMGRVNPERV